MDLEGTIAIAVSFATLIAFVISILNSRFHAGIAEGKRDSEAKQMIENDEKLEKRVDALEEKTREIDRLSTKMDFVITGIKELKDLFQDHLAQGNGG